MPIEYTQLRDRPMTVIACHECGWRLADPFMRGMVQSWWRRLLGMSYCAVICENCKNIVGWEKP